MITVQAFPKVNFASVDFVQQNVPEYTCFLSGVESFMDSVTLLRIYKLINCMIIVHDLPDN